MVCEVRRRASRWHAATSTWIGAGFDESSTPVLWAGLPKEISRVDCMIASGTGPSLPDLTSGNKLTNSSLFYHGAGRRTLLADPDLFRPCRVLLDPRPHPRLGPVLARGINGVRNQIRGSSVGCGHAIDATTSEEQLKTGGSGTRLAPVGWLGQSSPRRLPGHVS